MLQNYTSIEQSKKLLELGLDPNSADMCYKTVDVEDDDGEDFEYSFDLIVRPYSEYLEYVVPMGLNYKAVPCWSIGALLRLIPKNHIFNTALRIVDRDDKVTWSFCSQAICEHEFEGSSDIECLYEVVCWLLENNYEISRKDK